MSVIALSTNPRQQGHSFLFWSQHSLHSAKCLHGSNKTLLGASMQVIHLDSRDVFNGTHCPMGFSSLTVMIPTKAYFIHLLYYITINIQFLCNSIQYLLKYSLRKIPRKWKYQTSVGYSIILSLFIGNKVVYSIKHLTNISKKLFYVLHPVSFRDKVEYEQLLDDTRNWPFRVFM